MPTDGLDCHPRITYAFVPYTTPHTDAHNAHLRHVHSAGAHTVKTNTRAHERRLRLMNGDGLFRGSALEKVMRHDEQSKLASARYRPSSTGVPAGMESI